MRKFIKISVILLFLGFSLHQARAEELLTWEDCVREAAKNHPDLIAAKESVKQSEAEKKITASALFPQIDSSVSASTARTDTGASSKTGDTYSYGVTGTQLLFDGIKTINEVKAASENITAAKESFRFTSSEVRFRLRSAFVNLLKAQESLQITQEIFNIRRADLELITLRYQSGLEHKGALLTAEADLAQAEYEISQAKRNVEVAQRELVKEMGRMQLTGMRVRGDFIVGDAAKEKPDFEALAKNNPSLQQIIAQKNAAGFSLKSAYADFAPTLSGSGGANKTGSRWTPKNDQWNLGLTLSLPIFEGGLRLAQVSQAEALLNQLRANERSTKDSAVLTLEETWATLQDTIENVGVQKKSLMATEERSKIAEAQYSIGFISFDNWTIIQDNLVNAKLSYLNAQANALLAEANWILAKGETIEYAQN
ncbi:MAG: TolC family protein [Candidatus Omnitrophica bacterium]|nr:TolC family protein [Candidatus Omnitrophota bacterium]MDD5592745.1 TolC family protein [Candidatus Omnitrophota bacterium]